MKESQDGRIKEGEFLLQKVLPLSISLASSEFSRIFLAF